MLIVPKNAWALNSLQKWDESLQSSARCVGQPVDEHQHGF